MNDALSFEYQSRLLPALREDISLQKAATARDGAPYWNLYDPVRNRFFRIGWLEFEFVSRWQEGKQAEDLCNEVNVNTPLSVEVEDVTALIQFLQNHELLRCSHPKQRGFLQQVAGQRKQSWWKWLLHHYLFIRIPLIKPDAWLTQTMSWLLFAFKPAFFMIIALIGAVGLVRVADQWDVFSSSFLYFFSWQGALYFALALVLTKLVHEFGHAYTAKYYGLRVPNMGIAFMLLMPLFYTDTSEGWKLRANRSRVLIDAAGVIAELSLAAVALFVWTILPDGGLKSAVYILAAVTWISTLFINLNPFMRFDGYYLLMDALDVPNLQPRSFAVGRWQLRRWILGWDSGYPEQEYRHWHSFMAGYAYATWIYRFILFTIIAALVYTFFFKLLGMVLFLVEIGWLIALPIWREMKVWAKARGEWMSECRVKVSLLLLIVIFGLLLLPLRSSVQGEGYWQAAKSSKIYLPQAAQLVSVEVNNGQAVQTGDLLFQFTSPESHWQLQMAVSREGGTQRQIAATVGSALLQERAQVLKQQLTEAQASGVAQQQELDRLQIYATHDGVYRDLPEGLHAGMWLSPVKLLGHVVNATAQQAFIYVDEADVLKVQLGAQVELMTRQADVHRLYGQVSAIDTVAASVLPEPFLASTLGGAIGVREDVADSLIPVDALYRVTVDLPAADMSLNQMMPVTAFIEAERSSLLLSWLRKFAVVLARESGF